jgi:hypothetical protein
VVNGVLNLCFAPRDFGLEQFDPFVQFVDRIGVEVLLAQLRREIVVATRQIFVGVHAVNVDPDRGDVNKARVSTEGEATK